MAIASILLLLAGVGLVNAATITVGDNSTNYTSIQAAVNSANPGDTILVAPGTYTENVNVSKQLLIISTGGASVTNVVAASAGQNVFNVTSDGVTISGFTVSGATGSENAGIYLLTENNILSNNIVENNEYGIRLYESNNNNLNDNIAQNNYYGIFMYSSEGNTLRNNSMSGNVRNFGATGYYGSENDVDTSNTVDGKLIYYLVDKSGVVIDATSNAGTVYCVDSNNITIRDLTVSDNRFGVYLFRTINSKVENITSYNNRDGITLWYYADNNIVSNNDVHDNEYGIALRTSSENNIVSNNVVSDTASHSIQIYANNNTVINNIVSNGGHGIALTARNVVAKDNQVLNNVLSGLYLNANNGSIVTDNTLDNNGYGMLLVSSYDNLIKNNSISDNENGIKLSGSSSNNVIFNNLFRNEINVFFEGGNISNIWNTTMTAGENIAGGDYLAGNYWSTPDGTGFSQTGIDANGDGICDNAYELDIDNADYLPLGGVFNASNVQPVATIKSISPNPAETGESVYFEGSGNDTDGTVEAYKWASSIDGELSTSASFNTSSLSAGNHTISFMVQDNSGVWSEDVSSVLVVTGNSNETSYGPVLTDVTPSSGSTLAAGTTTVNVRFNYSDAQSEINVSSIIFTFDGLNVTDNANTTVITDSYANYNATGLTSGAHSASLYVADVGGNASTFSTSFTITKKSSSSSGGSSGGGGGGGSTGEKYSNILVKEVKSIYVINGAHISYDFSKDGNAISSVQFDALKNSGSIQAIVEVLKDRSSFADTDAPGEVYQQMNIWVGKSGFVSSDNVEKPLIDFKVEKSWLEDNNIEVENVMLYRYVNNAWEKLSTSVTGSDDGYVYFESETTGFSAFAISSESTPVEEELIVTEDEAESVDEQLMSVTDEEMTTSEDMSDAETSPSALSKTGIIVAMGIIIVLLAGGYLMYRKKN